VAEIATFFPPNLLQPPILARGLDGMIPARRRVSSWEAPVQNRIMAGIAAIAAALGIGAVITASYEDPRPSYGLHVVQDGRASSTAPAVIQPYDIEPVAH
jgi:hypothetical protein